jgi:Phage Tail Collar Domain
MAVTQTPNKSLNLVTVGTESGTWGPYVNANESLLDNMLGGVTTVGLVNTPVILSSAQYQCNFITFTGALSGNVAVTLPPVGSFYTVQNLTSNTSAFQVTLQTSNGGQVIGAPWGEAIDIMTDGTNVKFRNLGRVGHYLDMLGTSVPAWISACTVPPYLKCDGSTFSSATYPILFTIMGGTTLPDYRGRFRAYNDEGQNRIGGGNFLVIGGNTVANITQANLPAFDMATTVNDPGHVHSQMNPNFRPTGGAGSGTGGGQEVLTAGAWPTASVVTGISVTAHSGGSGTPLIVLNPVQMGGITMVRAA